MQTVQIHRNKNLKTWKPKNLPALQVSKFLGFDVKFKTWKPQNPCFCMERADANKNLETSKPDVDMGF